MRFLSQISVAALACLASLATSATAASFQYRVQSIGLHSSPIASAPAAPATCALPWGGTLSAGQSYDGVAYASSTAYQPAACVQVTESCGADGKLSYPDAVLSCSTADTYWANTTLLLSADSSLTDAKGHTFTATGATFSTTAKFGAGSFNFGGSGARVSTPASADFDFGTGDFTVEAWVNPTGGAGTWRELFSRYAGSPTGYHIFGMNQSNQVVVVIDGVARVQGATALPNNQWSHVAWARQAGTLRTFVNGKLDTTSAGFTYSMSSSNPLAIGSANTGIESFIGLMDEIRITKGVSRYNAEFAPLSVPFARM